jgi:hypothetical protein
MADEFDSALNSDKARNKSDRTPALPFVEGDFDVEVLAFKSVMNEETGRKFIAEFRVDVSNNPLVLSRSEYCLIWSTTGFKGAMQMAAERIRPFLASCVGADATDDSFDAAAIKTDFLNMFEKGETIGAKIRISRKKGKPHKTKKDDNGNPKVFFDDSFISLG